MNKYESGISEFQFRTNILNFEFGIDGISLWLIWLVNMLMPIIIISSWKTIKIKVKTYII